jgi:hypothetical protein
MNNTLHTPGPWNLNGNGILLHPVTNAQLVTQRIETFLGSFEVLDETNEPDANAHLISAAPDLLSAARNAANVLAALATGQLAAIHPDSNALQELRAAIAKAKGAK